jgi:histidinol phosphatase-like enzyme (inositol monophosphatase family)
MTPTSANEALAVAKQLARAAGDMALAGRKAGLHNVQTKSTGTDMVTEFDRASEAMIFDGLRTLRPLDSVVGEEGAAHSGESDITWFIDPIDGTKSFISGVPLYSTLVGLTLHGAPLLGVIAIPALGELVVAARQCGAWYGQGHGDQVVQLSRCHVSSVDRLEDGLFLTSQVDNFDRRGAQEAYRELERQAYVSRSWGDGYGYLLVATGRAELMVDPIVNPWDVAAVAPVIIEAGGSFTSWSGAVDLRAGHCFASNTKLHQGALEILKPYALKPIA